MRGTDYRSLTYVFSRGRVILLCERSTSRCFKGWYVWDPCRRVKFADCKELVNQQAQAEHNRMLLAFIEELKASLCNSSSNRTTPQEATARVRFEYDTKRIRALVSGQTSLFDFARVKP